MSHRDLASVFKSRWVCAGGFVECAAFAPRVLRNMFFVFLFLANATCSRYHFMPQKSNSKSWHDLAALHVSGAPSALQSQFLVSGVVPVLTLGPNTKIKAKNDAKLHKKRKQRLPQDKTIATP